MFATGALISFQKFGEIVDVVLQFFELLLKLYILFPELDILLYFGVNIFGRNVIDIGGHAGIGEGLQSFLKVGHGRVKACNHEAERVASDRLLQQGG